jgi:hypothetical protein
MKATVTRMATRSIPDPVGRRYAVLLATPPAVTCLLLAAAYALLSGNLPDPVAVLGVDGYGTPLRGSLWGHVAFTAMFGLGFPWMAWTLVRLWALASEPGARSAATLRVYAFLSWFVVGAFVVREGVSLAMNLGVASAAAVDQPAWAWPAGWACALLAGTVAALLIQPPR